MRLVLSARRSEHIMPLLRKLQYTGWKCWRQCSCVCVFWRIVASMALRHRTLLRYFSRRLMYTDVAVSGLLRRRHSSCHRHVEPPLVIVSFQLLRPVPGILFHPRSWKSSHWSSSESRTTRRVSFYKRLDGQTSTRCFRRCTGCMLNSASTTSWPCWRSRLSKRHLRSILASTSRCAPAHATLDRRPSHCCACHFDGHHLPDDHSALLTWNSLPPAVLNCDSHTHTHTHTLSLSLSLSLLSTLKSRLKTHLFTTAFC